QRAVGGGKTGAGKGAARGRLESRGANSIRQDSRVAEKTGWRAKGTSRDAARQPAVERGSDGGGYRAGGVGVDGHSGEPNAGGRAAETGEDGGALAAARDRPEGSQ